MPAWGVRTALTALRSFMAEKGSAGQVGGMEAKKDVREKLARESKSWKCDGCGGRTNEEIMREWWEICKERGVKVEDEIALEELPEGLNLEARDPKGKGKASEQESDSRNSAEPALSGPSSREPSVSRSIQCAADPPRPAPQPEDTQSGPSAAPRPTPTSSPSRSVPSTPAPPTTTTVQAVTNQVMQNATNHNREDLSTRTIDKAIGALVLALCIMILKKIFYPASGGTQGMEGVYMSGD